MSQKGTKQRGARRAWKWLAIAVVALLILPVVQVGCVRVVNPPATPLMLLRAMESRKDGHPAPAWRYQWIALQNIPPEFVRCVVASEDQRFFEHHGFDWREIAVAQREARRKGKRPRGASTITMQCARSLFLWQGRSWIRKELEAYYTFWMEVLLPKRRILELYVNVIEMGDGVYGVEAAAQAHFGISARALTREQCATLAAILPNPRKLDPRNPSPGLVARRMRILQRESALKLPRGW